METEGNTYSSAHLRERDKILEAKHQKELAFIERKVDRLRWSNDDILKQLFDVRTRGDKLARSLGFNNVHEAQVAIDTADHETPLTFKECLAQVDALQGNLARERTQHEKLREYLRLVEEERDQQKATAAAAVRNSGDLRSAVLKHQETSDRLSQEMSQLQSRYDALSEVKERAAERYKNDYQKWRKFKNWLFKDEEGTNGKDGHELSAEEKKRRRNKNVMKKKKLVMGLGPDYAENYPEGEMNSTSSTLCPPRMGRTSPLREECYSENEKENQITSISERKRGRLTEPPSSSLPPLSPTVVAASVCIPPSSSSSDATPVASTPLLKSLANTMLSASPPPPLSQTLTKTSRIPLTFRPIAIQKNCSQIKTKQKPSSLSPVPITRPLKRTHTQHAVSSDTEDDSQADDLFPAMTPVFKVPAPATVSRSVRVTPKLPIAMDASQTEDEPQSPSQMLPPSLITAKQSGKVPSPLTSSRSSKDIDRRRSDSGIMLVSSDTDTGTMPPPRKMRRLSSDDIHRTPDIYTSSAATAQKHECNDRDGRTTTPTSSKGKEKENIRTNTPTSSASGSASAQKRQQDYSAFKGRGRYAKDFTSTDKTINAEYAIDPARNGGLEFQYDEVARTKEDRRRLDAGDCECCRDYYTAIGPLPNRLHAPLWRSPTNSPVKSKGPCSRHGSSAQNGGETETDIERQAAAITSHKQAISRHRHQWERAHTPPGYWNIGFPDTQEAADINERAREMHRRKREEVVSEVRRGAGKYKRRQGT
ncbi:hypothetical protein L208DRAFT_1433702 [Tricholoma matsutake]|nr:hypothetical protein L208DRAFT_1441712 [Tricholoma matsutake 945]KAF8235740.1 hypothetical protein L208DRAFT_1433702 [Tricholoma matsutake 945]